MTYHQGHGPYPASSLDDELENWLFSELPSLFPFLSLRNPRLVETFLPTCRLHDVAAAAALRGQCSKILSRLAAGSFANLPNSARESRFFMALEPGKTPPHVNPTTETRPVRCQPA